MKDSKKLKAKVMQALRDYIDSLPQTSPLSVEYQRATIANTMLTDEFPYSLDQIGRIDEIINE
jgi:hypothetical protein